MQPEDMQEQVQQMIDDGMPRDQIHAFFKAHSEHAIDLDNMPKTKHNWVRRGIKISCEGAGHPHHSHFLFKR